MKRFLKSLYAACVAVIALVVVASAVLQFHHHDAEDHVCLYSLVSDASAENDCDCHHSHSDGCPAQDNAACSLHLDKFLTKKHLFCTDCHCAVHFASIEIPAILAEKTVFHPVPLVLSIESPDLRSPGLRAPPMIG